MQFVGTEVRVIPEGTRFSSRGTLQNPWRSDIMKLTYRGQTYNYDPSQARDGNTGAPVRPTQLSREPYTLIYRGLKTVVDPAAPAWAAALPAVYNLIYRGVTVQVNRDGQGQAIATTQPAGSAPKTTKPGNAWTTAGSKSSISQVHRANLLNNLQHRLDVARERGDMALVSLLESEQQQIAA